MISCRLKLTRNKPKIMQSQQPSHNILAIETCSEICSAAVYNKASKTLKSTVITTPRQHSKQLLPSCQALLTELEMSPQDLDLITVTAGPGAFTGVRIGAGATKGLAFALDIPIIAISTLQTIAMQAKRNGYLGRLHVLMDARMGELYSAEFMITEDSIDPLGEERLTKLAELDLQDTTIVGNAISAYRDELTAQGAKLTSIENPLAEDLIHLAHLMQPTPTSAAAFQPVYLRNKVTD